MKSIFFFCAVLPVLFAKEWDKVYLASFPRSGNHWVRFLVEEATHIATSSVYRDNNFPHLPTIFPWGGYCTDHGYSGNCRYPTKADPVLLKTHYPYLPKMIDSDFSSVICLIRHPVDAFWSFHIYKQKTKKLIKINKKQLADFIAGWKTFYEFWAKQPNVLFVRYEDLQENTAQYLSSILQTAGFSFSHDDVDRAVAKYPPRGTMLKHIGFYDDESIEIIRSRILDVMNRFGYDL